MIRIPTMLVKQQHIFIILIIAWHIVNTQNALSYFKSYLKMAFKIYLLLLLL